MFLQRIAVIGAGSAGRAFALRCAVSGLDVVLEDVMPSNLRRAEDEYAGLNDIQYTGSLRYALTVEDAVHEADIAIDFVPDELESKLEIFSLLDRMAPPRTILCTPSKALSITDLASCTYRPELCFALRGIAGSLLGGPLEIVRSKFSDFAALAAVVDFFKHLSLPPSIADDVEEPMLVKNLRNDL